MTKDEIKNRISLALKDPILQIGFELICTQNAKLKAYNEKLLNGDIEKHNKIVELEAQIEKMKDCLNRWYSQHNADNYTETFYESLLRDTEKCLWGDSVK